MSKFLIQELRPVAWKILVQGESEAEAARQILHRSRIEASVPHKEPSLLEPPLYALVVKPEGSTPLSSEQLLRVLRRDKQVASVN